MRTEFGADAAMFADYWVPCLLVECDGIGKARVGATGAADALGGFECDAAAGTRRQSAGGTGFGTGGAVAGAADIRDKFSLKSAFGFDPDTAFQQGVIVLI